MKKVVFYAVMLLPLCAIVAGGAYLLFFTNLPPLLYLQSLRNIYFDCMEFVPDDYVYKMKPGPCRYRNIEYDTILTHDADGFRNSRAASAYDVVTIGDSHTQGAGVGDDQTFSALLASEYGYATKNLGIASYATKRELEVLSRYGNDSKYVVIQYCDNDVGENAAAVNLSRAEFRTQVEREWRGIVGRYEQGKSLGYRKPIQDLAVMVANGSFMSLSAWRRRAELRNMEHEASTFAQIVAQYLEFLREKRLIVLEVADSGMNSPRFAQAFTSELAKIGGLNYKVIDSRWILGFDDYYFLDGHPKSVGHRKLAAAIAKKIGAWESMEPTIKR